MKKFGTSSFFLPGYVAGVEALSKNLETKEKFIARSAPAMMMRGNELRRSKRFFVKSRSQEGRMDEWYRYYYTGWTWASLGLYERLSDEKEIEALATKVSEEFKFDANHVILTRYDRDPKHVKDDVIGFHYDKTKDLAPKAPILIITLGTDLREFVVRDRFDHTKEILRVVATPGSLIYLSAKDNLLCEHAIVPTKHEKLLDKGRPIEGNRLSLVFRESVKIVTRKEMEKHVSAQEKKRHLVEEERRSWFVSTANEKRVHKRKACSQIVGETFVSVNNAKGKRFCVSCFGK